MNTESFELISWTDLNKSIYCNTKKKTLSFCEWLANNFHLQESNIPYILESNPHPFYSFRGLKNQMRSRFAVVSWILEKW